ncbi:MAG: HK97 family phage prohead protease, partial [Desulfobacteraceae bacterium]|nr:HK97 family phage prohead protease [Desulfobacteraceae bacterium]
MDYEEKTYPFEVKAVTEEGTFEGYAAIFGKPDAFGEVIEKNAFNKTLQEGKSRVMLWYHDPRNPIGTAELEVDDKGLKVKGTFDLNVQAAREKHSLMKSKVIKGLSFGFKTVRDLWDGTTRILKELKLFEVSPVTFGMHPNAVVESVKQWTEQKPYPNEHSARIKSPDLFDEKSFRRTKDGAIYGSKKVPATASVIWGKLKGAAGPSDQPQPQAVRFPTENWTVLQAKAWLKENNVKYERFEAASKSLEGAIEFLEEEKGIRVKSDADLKNVNDAIQALSALLESTAPPEGTQKTEEKGLLSPIVEVLEKPQGADKPHGHLFGS